MFNARVNYFIYDDASHEVRAYRGWDAETGLPTGPTEVWRDDRARGYSESLSMSATPALIGGRPTGAEAVSGVQSLSRTKRNTAGQAVEADSYFSLSGVAYSASATLGVEGVNYDAVRTAYGKQFGRQNRQVSAAGTVTRTEYDGLGRPVSEWVGTDDVPTTGYWSVTNLAGTDMVKVRDYEYDGGGMGDSDLTRATEYPGLGAAARVTQTWFDWRDRPVATKSGVEASESTSVNRPLSYAQYDNLGGVVSSEVYDGDAVTITMAAGVPQRPAAGLLRAKSAADYDELGRAYRQRTFSVDQATGAVSANALTTNTWYDLRGLVAKTATPGGLAQKTGYDGAGRSVVSYATDGGGDAGWADALTVTGDTVLSQSETQYDASGNAVLAVTRERLPGASGTGSLGTPSSGVAARVSYQGMYYDLADRPVASVNVGTNGGAAWARPAGVPARSDAALVTSTVYDAAGRAWVTTDPRGIASRTEYDLLGRVVKTVVNYQDGVPSDADDKTTEYAYGPAGMTSLTARLSGGGSQTTQWVYGVGTATGSAINSNDVVGETRWPDPSTGAASAAEKDTVTVNALGQAVQTTDRNGTVHALTYDALGRFAEDAVTLLGVGVDGAVRRVGVGYDGQGNASLVTSYSAASGGSVVNQVSRAYDGLGQLTSEVQSHAGAVTGSTPAVRYGYDFASGAGGANRSRQVSMTYPDGRVVGYSYGAAGGLDDRIGRLVALTDSGVTLEGYGYLGLGTAVTRSHLEAGVDLTYVKRAGESDGEAGDAVAGLDRFGRVDDQRWVNATTGVSLDRHTYGYDRGGNRTYRDDVVNPSFGEVYSYGVSQSRTANHRSEVAGAAGAGTDLCDYTAKYSDPISGLRRGQPGTNIERSRLQLPGDASKIP